LYLMVCKTGGGRDHDGRFTRGIGHQEMLSGCSVFRLRSPVSTEGGDALGKARRPRILGVTRVQIGRGRGPSPGRATRRPFPPARARHRRVS
jgi:hypothetical protein